MSATTTITMSGNSTGYGAYGGNEVFNLNGYDNAVLLDGANDQVNVLGGEYDVVNLNSDGFAQPVTDSIDLGTSGFNTVLSGAALTDSDVGIVGSGGPNTISLINHGGYTSVSLAYTGNPNYEWGLGTDDVVSLNGDASNNVAFTAGGYAAVSIGSAGDGFTNFTSNVALYGLNNSLVGGDEAFSVTETAGGNNSVSLGNGNSVVQLGGDGNAVSVGNGDNAISFSDGIFDKATLGTGSNIVVLDTASAKLTYAAGGSGANDAISLTKGDARITGGNENFSVTGGAGALLGKIGNGNNTIDLTAGRAAMAIGNTLDNTADNTVSVDKGFNYLRFDGGNDQVILNDAAGAKGFDTVVLNGSMLGTEITAHGAFDKVSLTHDANATINDLSVNGGLSITLDGDATGGFGTVAITGLAQDDLAHITLANASAYTITVDQTAVGGITLHFDHGSVDLVGLQAVPNNLIS